MTINNAQQKCAFCNSLLFEDDDIVYCPICGAPHHRECYKSSNHCALEHDHGTPNQYKRNVPPESSSSEAQEKASPHSGIPHDREGHVCPRCAKTSTSDTLFCPYCGYQLSTGSMPENGIPFRFGSFPNPMMFDPLGGVDPTQTIDDIPVSEISSFVKVNTQRYIPIFHKKLNEKKKVSWNWAGFLLPYTWLFFRKCYKSGIVALLISIASSLFSIPLQLYFNALLNSLPVEQQTYYELAKIFSKKPFTAPLEVWIFFGLSVAISLALRIIVGLYGDYFYKSHVIEKIKKLKSDDEIEDYHEAISVSGGANPLLALFSLLGVTFVIDLILFFVA